MSPSQHVNIPGYELVRELGVGGMATVYLAIQTSLDRKVALKVMRRNIEDVDKFERRFLMEGRTLAKLPHRNIVAVYDIVKGDAASYIAMEYLDGGTLHERMRDGLSLAEAVAIVVQIGGALQFAHDHGVIHRDLKPSNIMFRDESTPVLTDFGIARQQDAQQTRLTQTGMLVGTPTYMSPEQINALEVDGRSDLYSLGVMFYELLTGSAPFHGDTPIAVLMAHLTTPPPPLPAAFAEFQPVIDRMLAKNRDDRYANLKEFTKALKAVVIANETLWARLQADPNQSSSEQLRALGFSISAQTAGDLQQPVGVRRTGPQAVPSGRIPAPSSQATQVAGAPSPRTTERTGPGVPIGVVPHPTPAPAPSPLPGPAKPRWPLFAGVGAVLALVLAVGLWFGLSGDTEIDPKIKGRVDGLLAVVDSQIKANKLVPPPLGDNALDILREAQQLAPDYSETAKRRDALLAALVAAARADIDKADFDRARMLQNFAADLAGEDPGVQALQQAITDAQLAKANAAEIGRLLAEAEKALSAGRTFGSDSAYALLNSAQRLGPASDGVKAFRAKLMARVLNPVRTDLAGGNLVAAEAKLKQLETDLGNDPDWRALAGEVQKLKGQRELDGRMNQLYTRLEAQVRAGKLLAPAGDSALETLREAEALDARHAGLAQRRADLVAALLRAGQKDLDTNRPASAVRQADAVLAIDAANAQGQALKRTAEGQLGEAERKLAQALADAQNAVLDGHLYSPPGNNARELANAALKLDPANAEATKLLADLPGMAAAKIQAFVAGDDLAAADRLAREASAAHPGDTTLRALVTEVAAKASAREQQRQRGEQIEAVFAVAAAQPLVAADVERAIGSIDTLLKANPRDVDVLTARKRILDALVGAARSATSTSEFAGFERLLDGYSGRFPTDAALADARAQFAGVKTRLAAEEQRRLAETAGRLVLLAAPWGEVDTVVNSVSGQSVSLPADRATPIVLTVPAGVYRVTFRHPNARPVTQVGELKPKGEAQIVATFPALGKEEYLRRAGL